MNQDQQRAAFEAWYVEHFKEHTGRQDFTLEVMQSMRGLHNDYRENAYLHGLWIGHQAALASPEVQGLRDVLERCRLALEPYDDVKPRDWKSDRENLRYAHQAVCAALAAMEKQK